MCHLLCTTQQRNVLNWHSSAAVAMTFAREIHSVPSQSNYEAHAALCMTTCRPHSTSSLTDIIIKQPQYTSNTNKQHEKR